MSETLPFPPALNKVRMTQTHRHNLSAFVIRAVQIQRNERNKPGEIILANDLLAHYLGDNAKLFERCPTEWFPTRLSIKVSVKDQGFSIPMHEARALPTIPALYGFGVEGELAERVLAWKENNETNEEATETLRALLRATLTASRTVGAFLTAYPSALEFIPKDYLERLAGPAPVNLPTVTDGVVRDALAAAITP
jgi:hypothetical protein